MVKNQDGEAAEAEAVDEEYHGREPMNPRFPSRREEEEEEEGAPVLFLGTAGAPLFRLSSIFVPGRHGASVFGSRPQAACVAALRQDENSKLTLLRPF